MRQEHVKPDAAWRGAPTTGTMAGDAGPRVTAQSFRTLALRLRPGNIEPTTPDPPPTSTPEPPPERELPGAEPTPEAGALPEVEPPPAPEPPPEPRPAPTTPRPAPDLAGADAGEVVRLLLDIMARPTMAAQPQEREMAADILCRLVPRLPARHVKVICDRIAVMREPPAALLSGLLAHGEAGLVAPLLEGAAIGELELERVVATGDPKRLRLIARRRVLPQALVARLVASADPEVLLTLLRNPGAAISREVFETLARAAKGDPALMAPLATRADTPPAVIFHLFFDLPPELRRYVLSRYLVDSAAIGRMLKIAAAIDCNGDAPRSTKTAGAIVEALLGSGVDAAARLLAGAAAVPVEAAQNILADKGGEPLTIALKAAGMSRKEFAACLDRLKAGGAGQLPQDRDVAELQRLYDSLSYNKAKVLLTYWSWGFGKSSV